MAIYFTERLKINFMKNIFIKVKAGAKINKVEKIDELHYSVWVKSKAIKNKANEELIKVLSDYLNIAQNCITITKGLKSRSKVIKIN